MTADLHFRWHLQPPADFSEHRYFGVTIENKKLWNSKAIPTVAVGQEELQFSAWGASKDDECVAAAAAGGDYSDIDSDSACGSCDGAVDDEAAVSAQFRTQASELLERATRDLMTAFGASGGKGDRTRMLEVTKHICASMAKAAADEFAALASDTNGSSKSSVVAAVGTAADAFDGVTSMRGGDLPRVKRTKHSQHVYGYAYKNRGKSTTGDGM